MIQEETTLLNDSQEVAMDGLQSMANVGNRAGLEPLRIRNTFMDYFCNVAPIPWQDAHVRRGMFNEENPETDTFDIVRHWYVRHRNVRHRNVRHCHHRLHQSLLHPTEVIHLAHRLVERYSQF